MQQEYASGAILLQNNNLVTPSEETQASIDQYSITTTGADDDVSTNAHY